jgi:hypothetical protein
MAVQRQNQWHTIDISETNWQTNPVALPRNFIRKMSVFYLAPACFYRTYFSQNPKYKLFEGKSRNS